VKSNESTDSLEDGSHHNGEDEQDPVKKEKRISRDWKGLTSGDDGVIGKAMISSKNIIVFKAGGNKLYLDEKKQTYVQLRLYAENSNGRTESKYNFGFGTKNSAYKLDANCTLNGKQILGPPKTFNGDFDYRPFSFGYKYSNFQNNHGLKFVLDQSSYRFTSWLSSNQKSWSVYSEVMIPYTFPDLSGQVTYGIGLGTGSKGPIGSFRATYCFNRKTKACLGAGITTRSNAIIYFKWPFKIGQNPCSILGFCGYDSYGLMVSLNK